MASPATFSGFFRRVLMWIALGLAIALIAREVRKPAPGTAPGSEASAQAASVQDEVLADLVPDLVGALGRRDTRFVMDHVSTAFKEERGLDYYDVRALVEMAAFDEKPLGVRLDQLELTPIGDGKQIATARLSFARGQRLVRGEPLPEDAVTYAVDVVFARQGPRWIAVTGDYKRESAAPATEPATPPTSTR